MPFLCHPTCVGAQYFSHEPMSGHMILACPFRPSQPLVSAIQPSIQRMNPLSTCTQLTVSKTVISVSALLDSVSAGNLISGSLSRHLRLSTSTTETLYKVQSIMGKPITRRHVRHSVGPLQLQIGQLHQETLHLLVLEGSTVDIILGRPWLVQHNPILYWKTGEVLKWGDDCFSQCLPPRPYAVPPSSLNFIHIRKENEWKTEFVTPTGHYEYRVMPYGLVNAPSIFQGFMQTGSFTGLS